MVGFVHENDIPGAGVKKGALPDPVSARGAKIREVPGSPPMRCRRPAVDLLVDTSASEEELASIQAREPQRKLLVELFLPLPDHGRRHQDQDALSLAGDQQLADHETRLDRLAKPDLIRE